MVCAELVVVALLLTSACETGQDTGNEAAAPDALAGSPIGGASGGDSLAGTPGIAGSTGVGVGPAGSGGVPGTSGSGSAAGGDGTGAGGVPGTSGASGTGGSAGTAGLGGAGADGVAGTAGASGTAGNGGTAGTSGAAGSAGASGTGGTGGSEPPEPQKFCGNITTRGQVRSDFIDYWDQITPENEGKWGSVEGTRDQMRWGGLDAVYAYAMEHDIPFKQHTFVWGSQQPSWIGGLPQSEQRAEVEEWIRLFCERYPGTQMIDVVNEPPPHTTPVYAAALGGAGASGYDWIVQAFEWADQYCPDAILILNDYNTIEYGNDNANFIRIVKAIQAAGAPIDAVGVQAHAAFNVPTDTVRMYLDRIATETGLPVYVSEYDIDLADDDRQRQVMEQQFTMFWNHEDVVGVTLWGYVEGQTWLSNSGLMSSGGQQRPAMTWLMEFLGRQ